MSLTLAAYIGESIIIRYDPRDVTEIRVFYGNKFLCKAICQDLSGETLSLKDVISARQRRKKELNRELSKKRSIVDQLLYDKHSVEVVQPKSIKKELATKKQKIKLYHNE